jgi:glycosyltransferase involved in cell wall biosynthesis
MEIYINARFLTRQITGVERFAIEISKVLKDKLPNVVFVSPKNVVLKELGDYLNVLTVGNSSGHYWEQITLPRFLKKKGYPLLLNLTNTAPIRYNNKITTFCDISPLLFPEWYSLTFASWYKFLMPKLVGSSHHILTISTFCKEEIDSYFGLDYSVVKVIPCALPSTFITQPTVEKKEKYFLCVSSINPRKNFERVVRAFTLLNNKDYRLKIVGSNRGNFSNTNLSEIIKKDKNISLLGRVSDSDLSELYRNSSGFIYASLYEGFGIPPLEAQALGCPVLASDIKIHREVLGDSVFYCDPYSEKSIAEGIQELTSLEDDTIISLGLENVQKYSWQSSVDQLLNIINSIQDKASPLNK